MVVSILQYNKTAMSGSARKYLKDHSNPNPNTCLTTQGQIIPAPFKRTNPRSIHPSSRRSGITPDKSLLQSGYAQKLEVICLEERNSEGKNQAHHPEFHSA